MLDTWKECYLEVRRKIELSGRDARWEFDRKRLFERSDHIAQVCRDIHKIAQVCTVCIYMYVCECVCVSVWTAREGNVHVHEHVHTYILASVVFV